MAEDADNQSGHTGSVLDSVKRLVRTLAATVHNRVELLVVEIQEEGARFIGALLLAGVVMLFSGLALIMGMFTVLLAVGEEQRVLAAALMTGALLAGAVGAALWLAVRLKNWSAFPGTREELRKDRECLQSNTTET